MVKNDTVYSKVRQSEYKVQYNITTKEESTEVTPK